MEAYRAMGTARLYVLSESDIIGIIERTIQSCMKGERRAEPEAPKKRQKESALHNVKRLLRNYRTLKLSAANAVTDLKQLEHDAEVQEIVALMNGREDDTELSIESIQKSAAKTVMMIKHVDKMLEVYREYCVQFTDANCMRRYEITMDKYIRGDSACSVEELAERYYLSPKTVYRDLGIAHEEIAALIFGADGIRRGKD